MSKASCLTKSQHKQKLLDRAFNHKKNRVTLKVVCIEKSKTKVYYRLLAGRNYQYLWQRLGQRNYEAPWDEIQFKVGKLVWEESNSSGWKQYDEWKQQTPWIPRKNTCKHVYDYLSSGKTNRYPIYQCLKCENIVKAYV